MTRIPPNLTSTATASEFKRRIVLSSTAIPSDEDVAYIEPALLISQPSQQGFSMTKSSAGVSNNNLSDFTEPDLGSLLSKIKSTHAIGKTTLSQPASRDITHLFTRKNDIGTTTTTPTTDLYSNGRSLSNKRIEASFTSTSTSSECYSKAIPSRSMVGLRPGECITGKDGDICFNATQSQPTSKKFINPLKRSSSASSTWKESVSAKNSSLQIETEKSKSESAKPIKAVSKEDFKALVGT